MSNSRQRKTKFNPNTRYKGVINGNIVEHWSYNLLMSDIESALKRGDKAYAVFPDGSKQTLDSQGNLIPFKE